LTGLKEKVTRSVKIAKPPAAYRLALDLGGLAEAPGGLRDPITGTTGLTSFTMAAGVALWSCTVGMFGECARAEGAFGIGVPGSRLVGFRFVAIRLRPPSR
jgi:hypothetical protein